MCVVFFYVIVCMLDVSFCLSQCVPVPVCNSMRYSKAYLYDSSLWFLGFHLIGSFSDFACIFIILFVA